MWVAVKNAVIVMLILCIIHVVLLNALQSPETPSDSRREEEENLLKQFVLGTPPAAAAPSLTLPTQTQTSFNPLAPTQAVAPAAPASADPQPFTHWTCGATFPF